MRSARAFLVVCMLLCIGCTQQKAALPQHKGSGLSADAPQFTFAVISDRWGNRKPGSVILQDAIRELNVLDPDFVTCVGDLINDWGDASDEAALRAGVTAQWEEFDNDIAKLERPFYHVYGNHDAANASQMKILRERYGPLYYSYDHKGCHFIVLFTESQDADGKFIGIDKDEAQVAWLEKDLAAHRDATHTFVFFHRPWPSARILDLFKGRPTTMFAGHWHAYSQFVKDGVNYHVLSSTGASVDPDFYGGGLYHYMLVSVRGKQVKTAIVRVGATVPDDFLGEKRMGTIYKARQEMTSPRVSVPRGAKSIEEPIEVRVPNPLLDPIKGTLVWLIAPGSDWTVSPGRADVLVDAGGEKVHRFRVTCSSDPFATPPDLLPRLCMDVMGGRALAAHSPAVAGLDPLYVSSATLVPDRWPGGDKVEAMRKSLALVETKMGADFAHDYALTVKNPFDEPLGVALSWQNANAKWSVSPDSHAISLEAQKDRSASFSVKFTGTPHEVFPLPRLRAKATLDGETFFDETQPLPIDATGLLEWKGPRSVVCPMLKEKPVLDGKLDDEAWRGAAVLDDFLRSYCRGEPTQPTIARVGATAEGLWLSFLCAEPRRQEIRPRYLKHDQYVWRDNSIEVQIDVTNERKTCHHIIINTAGVGFDSIGNDRTWDGRWQVKFGWPDGGWSAEVFVPWDSVGGRPAPGATIGFNVGRFRTFGFPHLMPENSKWSHTAGTAFKAERLGSLVLEKKDKE